MRWTAAARPPATPASESTTIGLTNWPRNILASQAPVPNPRRSGGRVRMFQVRSVGISNPPPNPLIRMPIATPFIVVAAARIRRPEPEQAKLNASNRGGGETDNIKTVKEARPYYNRYVRETRKQSDSPRREDAQPVEQIRQMHRHDVKCDDGNQ